SSTTEGNADPSVWLKTELYFGVANLEGRGISEEEWQAFINDVVTPLFQEGMTIYDAYGQWQNSSGKIARIRSKVLILVYQPSPQKEKGILTIEATFKEKFNQKSVMRLDIPVKASF
ncbi:MAG: DUF3574 domain-containing protein, partial [Cyanothece sp. SIO2G6]|nr:DUF3574 domain-containing protein [Cyanothece sp. SIO2G6]